MRVFRTAVIVALLAGPAYAQQAHVPGYGESSDKTPQQKEEDKANEKAYKRSLGSVPDKPATDPWGTARSVGEPKADAKPSAAKPRTKTGSSAN